MGRLLGMERDGWLGMGMVDWRDGMRVVGWVVMMEMGMVGQWEGLMGCKRDG